LDGQLLRVAKFKLSAVMAHSFGRSAPGVGNARIIQNVLADAFQQRPRRGDGALRVGDASDQRLLPCRVYVVGIEGL
jgi:hypothetical protein